MAKTLFNQMIPTIQGMVRKMDLEEAIEAEEQTAVLLEAIRRKINDLQEEEAKKAMEEEPLSEGASKREELMREAEKQGEAGEPPSSRLMSVT